MSPSPWSKMISAATRLSAHPNTTAVGFWPSARLARCFDALAGMLWLTGDESVVTLAECLPCGHRVRIGHGGTFCLQRPTMIDAGELLRWYRAGAAGPAVATAGCHGVADPGQRVHVAADPGRPGRADLARLGGPLADAVRHRRGERGRRPAGLGQARLSAPGQAVARVRDGDRHRARRRGARRRRRAARVARRRHVHRAGDRVLRLRQAGSRRRHQRAPRGRQGRARPGRLARQRPRPRRRRRHPAQ